MIALLDEYKTQLSEVCGYVDQTVENYASCMGMFARHLKELGIPVVKARGAHICLWIAQLKQEGLGYSRLEHHRSALKTFYAMLVKLDIVIKSPAAALPRLKKNGPSTVMPVSKATVFKLLNIVDRSTWMENRNYLILSLLWALGFKESCDNIVKKPISQKGSLPMCSGTPLLLKCIMPRCRFMPSRQ